VASSGGGPTEERAPRDHQFHVRTIHLEVICLQREPPSRARTTSFDRRIKTLVAERRCPRGKKKNWGEKKRYMFLRCSGKGDYRPGFETMGSMWELDWRGEPTNCLKKKTPAITKRTFGESPSEVCWSKVGGRPVDVGIGQGQHILSHAR